MKYLETNYNNVYNLVHKFKLILYGAYNYYNNLWIKLV